MSQMVKRSLDTMSCWLATVVLTLLFASLTVPSHGADVTLQWDANVEQDLRGYNIYYKAGSSGPPYTGLGAWEGESPIAVEADDVHVGDVSRFTLTGLSNTQTYYFALTAYDTVGRESDYSDEVSFTHTGQSEYPTISDIWPPEAEPTTIVALFGSGFGDTQRDGIVNIGQREFTSDHPRLAFWSDAIILVRIPFGGKECEWWKGKDLIQRKLWVTVGGVDSNEKILIVAKPEACVDSG